MRPAPRTARPEGSGELKSSNAGAAHGPRSFDASCPAVLRNATLPGLLKCDLPHDSTVTTAMIASPSGLDVCVGGGGCLSMRP